MTRNKDTDYNNNNTNNNNHYNKFERKISRLFDDFLNDVGFTRTHGSKFRGGDDGKHPSWSPAIDIKDVDREYIIIADVPVSFLFFLSLIKKKKNIIIFLNFVFINKLGCQKRRY